MNIINFSTYSENNIFDINSRTNTEILFQFLPLALSKKERILKPKYSKIWKFFLNKKNSELNQVNDVKLFKTALIDVLNAASARMPGEEENELIKELIHDLKHQNILNIFAKYYCIPPRNGTILSELAPYLGNKDKIQDLIQLEAELLPDEISLQFNPQGMNRDSLMSLIVQKKREQFPDFKCFIIDFRDLHGCLKCLKTLNLAMVDSFKIQFLVRTEMHYTCVVIDYQNRIFQSAVLEAAGDPKCLEIISALKYIVEEENIFVLGIEDRIQYDLDKCAYFSFDSAWQAYKVSHFFDLLGNLPHIKKDDYISIAWKDMPPSFVKNSTSTKFMLNYPDRKIIYKNNDTFKTYINKHISQIDLGEGLRNFHNILEKRVKKLEPKIKEMFTLSSNTELFEVINRYSIQGFLNFSLSLLKNDLNMSFFQTRFINDNTYILEESEQ